MCDAQAERLRKFRARASKMAAAREYAYESAARVSAVVSAGGFCSRRSPVLATNGMVRTLCVSLSLGGGHATSASLSSWNTHAHTQRGGERAQVAASQPLAVEAGLDVLKRGGNAAKS